MPSVHIITQGCSANIADSEVMAGILQENGFQLVDSAEEADIIVFNSCTVKGPTESTFRRKLKEFKKLNRKVVVAGCIPQSSPKEFSEYSRIGTYQIKKIAEAVKETLKGKIVSFLDRIDEGRLNIKKVRKNDLIEIVPISQGCLNSCAYCKTKQARGNLISYPVKDIVRHISKAVEQGAKEVWITSQDNAVYGLDIGTNLVELLTQILTIKRDFKIRIGMANPKYLAKYINDLLELMKDDRIFKFLHIPVQSGSNKVLKDMNRDYTAEDYGALIKKIKNRFPMMSVATDIIVAYPTETKKDFQQTIDLINEAKPDMINTSRFWSRPGTPAAKLKEIDGLEAKNRAKTMMDLFRKVGKSENSKWIGKTCNILITEKGKNNTWIGKNESYKQVILKGDFKSGQEVNVRIIGVTSVDLRGELN